MSNVLTIPASGAIIFDSQAAGSSTISPLSSAPRLQYDNAGGLNITSFTTGTSSLDRFTVDGANGRLFGISDAVTGVIFSVNDAAGLPIMEVNSTTVDTINIGSYGTNALFISGSNVSLGTGVLTFNSNQFSYGAGSAALHKSSLGLGTSDSPTFSGIIITPAASVTPANNGQLIFEATNDTTLTIKFKGSDGTVRSVALTLS